MHQLETPIPRAPEAFQALVNQDLLRQMEVSPPGRQKELFSQFSPTDSTEFESCMPLANLLASQHIQPSLKEDGDRMLRKTLRLRPDLLERYVDALNKVLDDTDDRPYSAELYAEQQRFLKRAAASAEPHVSSEIKELLGKFKHRFETVKDLTLAVC